MTAELFFQFLKVDQAETLTKVPFSKLTVSNIASFEKLQCHFLVASGNLDNFSVYVHCIRMSLLYSLAILFL